MFSQIRIDRDNRLIIINSSFAKRADRYNTSEYAMLQEVKRDYPEYKVMTRRIKTKPGKQTYKGLTFDYMEKYILTHDLNAKEALCEFSEMKFLADCHKNGYPIIKQWFLNKYPEIAEFGVSESEYVEMPTNIAQ